jgi:sugar lactone lactonase YvrE
MKKFRTGLTSLGAAAIAAALVLSCDGGAAAPQEQKRQSYFEVVAWFKAPGKGLADLTWARGHLWLADEEGAGRVYKIDPANGRVLSAVGTSYGAPSALCTDGAFLYVAHGATGDVYRHELTPRLEERARFPTGLADIRGMYFDAGTFYLFDQATGGVHEFDTSWNAGRAWRVGAGEETIRGLTRADGRVWSADWRDGWLNRHRRTSFDLNLKFCTPGWHPAGLAWDGSNLYLGDTGARRLYKLDLSTAP